jgi:hypothetical protein
MSTREIVDKMTEISNDPITANSHDGIKIFLMYYIIACRRVNNNPKGQLQRMKLIDNSVIEEGISEGWIDESEV